MNNKYCLLVKIYIFRRKNFIVSETWPFCCLLVFPGILGMLLYNCRRIRKINGCSLSSQVSYDEKMGE